jgi:3-methylcrotonyl-CoA carboxylase alpha subunit/geranyl-CoA carboxylase alpha subunit
MHGRIIQISTTDQNSVTAGQLLVVMEAMKMEHHLLAPCDARIEQILVRAGDQVASGQTLIMLG